MVGQSSPELLLWHGQAPPCLFGGMCCCSVHFLSFKGVIFIICWSYCRDIWAPCPCTCMGDCPCPLPSYCRQVFYQTKFLTSSDIFLVSIWQEYHLVSLNLPFPVPSALRGYPAALHGYPPTFH